MLTSAMFLPRERNSLRLRSILSLKRWLVRLSCACEQSRRPVLAVLSVATLSIVIPVASRLQEATGGKSIALVIGVSNYQKAPALSTPENDAMVMQNQLVRSGFEVTLLRDPDRREILRKLDTALTRKPGPEDQVLVYFSGHTMTLGGDEGQMGFLLPVEASFENPMLDGISLSTIKNMMLESEARSVLIVLDACSALPFVRTRRIVSASEMLLGRLLTEKGRQVITSCAPREGVVVSPSTDRGLFVEAFVEGLAGEALADHNGDKVVTTQELFAYLQHEVAQRASSLGFIQTPSLVTLPSYNGSFSFSVVPEEMQERLAYLTPTEAGASQVQPQELVKARSEVDLLRWQLQQSAIQIQQLEKQLAELRKQKPLGTGGDLESSTDDSWRDLGTVDVDIPSDAEILQVFLDGEPAGGILAGIYHRQVRLRSKDSFWSSLPEGAHRILLKVKHATRTYLIEPVVFWKEEGKLQQYAKQYSMGKRFAVVIGIGKYQSNSPDLEDLPAASRQARKLGEQLEANGFEVKYFLDNETERIDKKLIEDYLLGPLNAELRKHGDDTLVFYFGGHGITRKDALGRDIGYLLPNTYDVDNIPKTGISMVSDIRVTYASLLEAKHILFAIDACLADVGLRNEAPSDLAP